MLPIPQLADSAHLKPTSWIDKWRFEIHPLATPVLDLRATYTAEWHESNSQLTPALEARIFNWTVAVR